TVLAAGHEDRKAAYEIRSTKQNHRQSHFHHKRSDYVAGKVRRDDADADGVGPDHRISSGPWPQSRRFGPAYHQSDSRLARQRVRAFGRQPWKGVSVFVGAARWARAPYLRGSVLSAGE